MDKLKSLFEKSDYILLDMDGTLLDKYFDDYFWEHFLPEKYAEKNNIPFETSKEELLKKYKQYEGTLKWTDINFWSEKLKLNIPALKEELKHIIKKHPYVEEFLETMKNKNKKIYLITDAHYKSIELKLNKTNLERYFDNILSSFDVGFPKGNINFWQSAQRHLRFEKDKSIFIDDIENILLTAKEFGIKYLLFKANSSSKKQPKTSKHFPQFFDFSELI